MFTYMLTIISADYPVRRSADLQSAVKKCPNLFGHCGFAIRNIQFVVLLGVFVGDYKSPGLIGRTFFYGGFQIRRNA